MIDFDRNSVRARLDAWEGVLVSHKSAGVGKGKLDERAPAEKDSLR